MQTAQQPTYGPLVTTCKLYGIGRTTAYRLVEVGMLHSFKIGASRFVYIASLRSLPRRLSRHGNKIPA